jgi:hypothetical protein
VGTFRSNLHRLTHTKRLNVIQTKAVYFLPPSNHLRTPLVWIEQYPPETTNNRMEIFDLVSFSYYEVIERGPYLGQTRIRIGDATWKRLTRDTVEVLVGQDV